jgi:2-oxo-4-hydroxy-4-carboxy-5-ureidoimidazoline decarboxylase
MTVALINSLATLNEAPSNNAYAWFMQTCTSEKWCLQMTELRPFKSVESLNALANQQWLLMQTPDHMQAFSGHPMIGDMSSLREKYANTKALASNEQSGTQSASEATLQQLQKLNKAYADKHGFIFIICATGLSAEAMLNALEKRLPNSTSIEIQKAAAEQIKITLLRISKAFNGASA